MWKIDINYSRSISKMCLNRKRYYAHELSFRCVQNAVVLPYVKDDKLTYGLGGVVLEHGEFVKESGFSLPINESYVLDWGGSYRFKKSDVEQFHCKVIYGGFINNNEWGHFLVDWCVRLWYAVINDRYSKIVFCKRGKERIHANILRVMELAGVSESRLVIIQEGQPPKKYDEVVIPEPSLSWEGYTDEYVSFFRNIVSSLRSIWVHGHHFEKVYLSRTNMKPCKEYGEAMIENVFRKNGYHIIHPEQMSVEEQIYCLMDCEVVASLEGSAAHNILFCKPGTKQIILEKQEIVNDRQMFLNAAMGNRVRYVTCYPHFRMKTKSTAGPYIIGITKEFQKAFGTKIKGRNQKWLVPYVGYMKACIAELLRNVKSYVGAEVRKIYHKYRNG